MHIAHWLTIVIILLIGFGFICYIYVPFVDYEFAPSKTTARSYKGS